MTSKPEWCLRYEASVKSIKNERKEQHEPKPCSLCKKEFRPEGPFARFCNKCKIKMRKQ